MRTLRLFALFAGIALLATSVWSGVAGARERERDALDGKLQRHAEGASMALEAYFERARALTLMLARNEAFGSFYAAPGTRLEKLSAGGTTMEAVASALDYVEQLYPDKIGEVCFIDRSGAENGRYVRGVRAETHELSLEEAAAPFFGPTFALRPGQVYQARPYVSPDTNEWVISNSTLVPTGERKRAIVHFEVTIESFRQELAKHSLVTQIVENSTGRIVIDSDLPQRSGRPLGRPAGGVAGVLVRDGRRSGLHTVDGQRIAIVAVDHLAQNQNQWSVVVSSPAVAGVGLGGIGWHAAALMLAALLALGIAFASFRSYQRELRRAALTDALTGLPNRTLFHDRAQQALLLNRRACATGAVVMLDLDRFKDVNDTLGHGHGDLLLQDVGRRLRACLRASDTIARIGGDEFAILLPEVAGPEAVEAVVARMCEALDEPIVLDGVSVQVESSFGIVLFPGDAEDVSALIQRADIAMYEAKRRRSVHAFYETGQDSHSERRLGMVVALKEAIDRRDLYLHYQPKLELGTGRVTCVEALARWEHPTLGPVGPLEFVGLAEDTGLIRPLTLFVLDEALRQLRAWLDAGLDLSMAVNISSRSFHDQHLVREIADALSRHGVPAERLELEITESSIMAEPERARAALDALHEMRVKISVDDFGTGHSALAYLKNLPIDELKIDRCFVMNMASDATDDYIVRSTIDLGHNLGLSVVAEGVEDRETLSRLTALGCTLAQGYYVSRPISASDLERWMKECPVPASSPALTETAPAPAAARAV